MAIALVGSPAVPTGNPTTSFTVTVPAAVQAGHVLFLAVTSRDSAGAGTLSVTDNDTGGNTWAKIGNSTDHKATLWYKRATSGTAGKTVTVNNAVGSASGVLKAFSGASEAATPYTDVVVETNASGNETHAAFTPTYGDSMVCAAVFNYADDNAVTSLSFGTLGATTATEKTSTGGSDCGCIFGHALQTGGPTSTGSLTWAQVDGTTYSITWAIKSPYVLTASQGSFTRTGQAATLKYGRVLQASYLTAGAGRAIVLDGTNDYGFNTDTGTAVPSAQSGWRFMARVRGLASPADTTYLFRDSAAGVLRLDLLTGGGFGVMRAFVGPGADGTGTVTLPAADCIVLVRANPAGTEVSIEAWDTAGANRVGAQNTSASSSATNFQNRNITFGAFHGPSNFFAGKVDRAGFKSGAGSYNSTAPDVLGETLDIIDWTFDADDGTDATGHANLTLSGSPAFENTPGGTGQAFVLTGQAATLKAARQVTAAQGSYALSGQAATLTYAGGAPTLTAGAGSFALSGQAASLKAGRALSAVQGSLSLSGQTATLKRGSVLQAGQGSLSLAGQSVSLTSARRLSASAGSLTLSGQAAGLTAGRSLTASQGAYALTGPDAGLLRGRLLQAGHGAFTASGQAVTFTAARQMSAGQGSYALSGQGAALKAGRMVSASTGSFTLSGQSADFRAAKILFASVGSFALSGQDAALHAAKVMTAGAGTFTLSGQAASLVYQTAGAYTLIAAQGSFSLAGQTANLTVSRHLPASSASFSLAGQAVELRRAPALGAAGGSYALSGGPAFLRAARSLSAAYGSFVLTGYGAELSSSAPVVKAEVTVRVYAANGVTSATSAARVTSAVSAATRVASRTTTAFPIEVTEAAA